MRSRYARVAIALFWFVGACTPLKSDSRAHSNATKTDAGAATSAGASGMSSSTDTPVTTPSAGTGGTAGSSAGAESAPDAGVAGSSSAPAANGGAGAAADSNTPMKSEVRGKVIDPYRQPVPEAQVTIGSTTTTTGSNGEFTIPAVDSTYDATLLISYSGSDTLPRYIWRFEGLTRRDPTLQVDIAGEIRSGSVEMRIAGIDFENLASGETVLTSFGGPSGVYETPWTISAMVRDLFTWRGPASTRFTAHALRILQAESQIEPSEYVSYDSEQFTLDADGSAQLDLDLARRSLAVTQRLRGALDKPAGTQPHVDVYLRFADYAAIPVIADDSVGTDFDYHLPSVPAATITAVATLEKGDGVLIAHLDHTGGDTPVTLRLPAAPALVEPASSAMVSAETSFKWSGDSSVFVFRARSFDRNDALQVVTSSHEAKLPPAPGYALRPNDFTWWIETHGTYANMDEATGPDGFLDTCASRRPIGPERGAGSYAESVSRNFKTP
jgi:hypothetical protein